MSDAMARWLADAARVRVRRELTRRAEPAPDGTIDLASNDYLGLSRHPYVVEASVAATRHHGAGARASRVVAGTTAAHVELEDELVELADQPAALVFSSGYAANLAILASLGGPATRIVLDEHVHASFHDAARLSRSPVTWVPHGNLDLLTETLVTRAEPRCVVVIESVYSVLGDLASLDATAEICSRSDAHLVVDEAHGIGVLGGGRGAVQAAGLAGAGHVTVTATLSKALGAMGGAVLGSRALRDHLVSAARTFLFDTGLAPGPTAAAAAACRIVRAEPERVSRLDRASNALARAMGRPRTEGPIHVIPVGSAADAAGAALELLERGVLVGCFRPPSTPDGTSRLRVTAHADVGSEELERAGRLVREVIAARAGTRP